MNVIKIAPYSKGLTAKQAIDTANRKKIVLLTNKEFDKRLMDDTYKSEKEFYPAWTGTLVAYAKRDKKVDKFIEYTDTKSKIRYVFESGDAKGETNVLLAINHGFTQDGKPLITYNQDGKNTILVQIAKEAKVDVIPNFPVNGDYYLTESKFGIPVGERARTSNDARYLHRYVEVNYVGLLSRAHLVIGCVSQWNVYAISDASERHGVLGKA
ncbi:MAG: hypothetical protein NTV88_03695 [Candidatus Micrarchaeota archaeon]|nr:hypothetical protein [Candidatus Micrarchaeota archaeon]